MSVVVPLFNEEAILPELHRRLSAALAGVDPPIDHEILYVDDGSTDSTAQLLQRIATDDPSTRILHLSRNFGHQIAITAGLDHAGGDAVVIIDGDLQDPPELIPRLVERWRDGWDVVYAVRSARRGEGVVKRLLAASFYRMISRLSDVPMPEDVGDFRLVDRVVADAIRELREESRYLRGMVAWVGFRQTGVPYERDPRFAGVAKYTFFKSLRLALDGVTGASERPLRLAAQLGFLTTGAAALLWAWIIVGRFLNPTVTRGWTSLMAVVLMLGGVQLISVGVLGEYVGRIYRESKQRPLYFVARRSGFSAAGSEKRPE